MEQLAVLPRLLLVYAHLLLCVFALYQVLSTDWALLNGKVQPTTLHRTHKRVSLLLAGLWLTGVWIIGIDLDWNLAQVVTRPKLLTKLTCVTTLTLNGALLRWWCFPRLSRASSLSRAEAMALMSSGAISTTSWLMAAFIGIARPMSKWTLGQCLGVYALALAVSVPVALLLESRLRQSRAARIADVGAPSADRYALDDEQEPALP